jgi:hypothetical protein
MRLASRSRGLCDCIRSFNREHETATWISAQRSCHLIEGNVSDVDVIYGMDKIILLQQPAGFCCTAGFKSQNSVRPRPAIVKRHAHT